MNIVAVIPARNEGATIAKVVHVALSHPRIQRVIVSDSASRDDTATQARAAGAEVVRVDIPGKGQAMQAATSRVSDATHFLFLDADLLGLTTESISSILNLLSKADMAIGIQDRGWFINFFTRHLLPWLSGQRIVPRELWDAIPAEMKEGYRVEAALNFFAKKLKMTVRACTLKGVGALLQEEKRSGLLVALRGRYYLITEVLTTLVMVRLRYWQRADTQEKVAHIMRNRVTIGK